ncbi:Zn-finger, prokaryotic DksA/TraR C4 type [Beggiatoa sp. PS]|nr:Zn-finger, prokaryotic DksA/TraR C4 type [Beggiatoa sp. PS]
MSEVQIPTITPYHSSEGEEYMSNKQLEHFQRVLLQWKQNLMDDVTRTVHQMQDNLSNFADPNDRATQEEEFTIELRTRDRERKLIKKIDASLKTIDTKEYGFVSVVALRLVFIAWKLDLMLAKCIDCKTRDEVREKLSQMNFYFGFHKHYSLPLS